MPNGMANFYNIYNPAQGTASGLLGLPELRQPGAVHLRRHLRRRAPHRTTTSEPRSAASVWARCSTHRDELPAVAVPCDQQHHRVQGPDPLRHPCHRSQGPDTVAVPPVAERARRDPATANRRDRPELAVSPAGARIRAATYGAPSRPRRVADAENSARSCHLVRRRAAGGLPVRRAELAEHAGHRGPRRRLLPRSPWNCPMWPRCRRTRR